MSVNTNNTANQAVKGVAKQTSTGTTLQAVAHHVNPLHIISGDGSSIEKHFCDVVMAGHLGMFAVDVTSELDPGILRKWNGQYWYPVYSPEIETVAAEWLDIFHPDEATPAKVTSCVKLLTMRLRKMSKLNKVDLEDAVVLPTPSGYLHILPNGSIHCLDPDPELGLTHGINIPLTNAQRSQNYEPQSVPANSKFGKMLSHALPNSDVQAFVQEQCALTLMPGNMSHCAWWHGAPAASKSTLAEMMASVSCQVARLSMDDLNERFGLERIVGASLILVDECDGGKIGNEGKFKSLVSGNGIGIDRKNEKAIPEYHSSAKWIVSCQDAPFFKDKSGAMERRVGAVPFKFSVPADERVLNYHKVLLKEEGHIFLDWLLDGLRRVVRRGRIMTDDELPEELRDHQEQIRLHTDSLLAWVRADGVTHTPNVFNHSRSDVYNRYEAWCSGEARKPLDTEIFWRKLRDGKYIAGWEGESTQCKPLGWAGNRLDRPRFVPFWFGATGP